MATIFGAMMLRVHFDGLVLTASAAQHDKKQELGINVIKQHVRRSTAFGSDALHGTGMLHRRPPSSVYNERNVGENNGSD
ncbi:hypothetical protein SCLCIDRAFT_25916 [Scleroderma citrinum Foug A]|uniref:Uncharacterized protein n=1 Tax=Scleroderma citrinum Foug A TaxID=1036808 RepID=A0A0C2ZIH4_9AGAM|nr:hypothetical protein SCLCIDRAFT_25916 [Scleroderma citrinum Foug A]